MGCLWGACKRSPVALFHWSDRWAVGSLIPKGATLTFEVELVAAQS